MQRLRQVISDMWSGKLWICTSWQGKLTAAAIPPTSISPTSSCRRLRAADGSAAFQERPSSETAEETDDTASNIHPRVKILSNVLLAMAAGFLSAVSPTGSLPARGLAGLPPLQPPGDPTAAPGKRGLLIGTQPCLEWVIHFMEGGGPLDAGEDDELPSAPPACLDPAYLFASPLPLFSEFSNTSPKPFTCRVPHAAT
mmetsp:Transcript_32746/g.92880  ORF Transcript_32746/g.92880 Transcript_32746/m.92880 type:complete len:198 (+) Transcript_32746:1751-2344(+)